MTNRLCQERGQTCLVGPRRLEDNNDDSAYFQFFRRKTVSSLTTGLSIVLEDSCFESFSYVFKLLRPWKTERH